MHLCLLVCVCVCVCVCVNECLHVCVCVGACVILLPLATFTGSLKLFFTLCLKQFSISVILFSVQLCVFISMCVRNGGVWGRGELFLHTRLHPIHFELASCFPISRRLIYLL